MKKIKIVTLVLLLAGCATQEQTAQRQELLSRVDAAEQAAVVRCAGKDICDKSWKLTKAYIQKFSSMKIQFSDDTSIFTYGPTDWTLIGMQAARTPGAGDSETIRLGVSCKLITGTTEDQRCTQLRAVVYEGFPKVLNALQVDEDNAQAGRR